MNPASTRGRRLVPALAAGALALASLVSACSGKGSPRATSGPPIVVKSSTVAAGTLRGTLLPHPVALPPQTFTDTAGRPYDLRTRDAGQITLLYFGYTHCLDICPTTMADLAVARNQLVPLVRSKVQVVFVTVDPRRDTSSVIRAWLNHFSSSFVGLRAPIRTVAAAQTSVGVPASNVTPGRGEGYTVQHSAETLLFGTDGVARVLYTAGTPIAAYVHDIPLVLQGRS